MSQPITYLVNRDRFGIWLNENGITGQGVEIGTFRGEFAAMLASQWAGELVTVDSYAWETDKEYLDGCVKDWGADDGRKLNPVLVREEARERLSMVKNCRALHMTSAQAAAQFAAHSLAFVYLDGNHAYKAVKDDLAKWWDRVKLGGVVGGHDFYDRHDEHQESGVFSAVWEFCQMTNRKPHVTCCSSWWIVK